MVEPPAQLAYSQMQELIFNNPRADLSVYRFQLDKVNHVAAVGEPPPEDVQNSLNAILSAGEPVSLPSEILQALYQRRTQMKKHGDWVEGHYRPGKKLNY
jgi:hypothetical protein